MSAPRPAGLISVSQLHELLGSGDVNVRVVDARWYLGRPGAGRAAYDEGHIPGALFMALAGVRTQARPHWHRVG